MHFWDDYSCVLKGTCSPAEASIKDVRAGVEEYLQTVPKDKLLLGLPWYGQLYQDIVVPWNKGQIRYNDTLKVMNISGRVKSKTYDEASQTWKLVCNGACLKEEGKSGGIIWYDDAVSLKPKYALAKSYGLQGIVICTCIHT